MKLSFSTNAFTRYSVFDAVDCIAAIGYAAVEVLADVPHLYADSVSISDVDKLKRRLDRTGLQVANINANTAVGYYGRHFWEPLFEPSLANPDPALRNWRIAYSKKCIDLAHDLNAPCISVTSGRMVPGISPDESMLLLKDSLKQVLDYADQRSIRVGVEYEPGILIERYEELVALMQQMNSAYLGANLDLGHSHVLGENPETVITGLATKILHVHIEDILDRKHYHLIPGHGDMDFAALFALLDRQGYSDYVTVELYTYPHDPETAAREAFSYLRPLLPCVIDTNARSKK